MTEEEELWTFTLSFYALPGVSESCLRLQEEAGVDVNLLLTGLWLGLSGRGAIAPEWRPDPTLLQWREQVVQPLRDLRRLLKGTGEEDFREDVRRLERSAERRYQQKLLLSLRPHCQLPGNPTEDASKTLPLLGGGSSLLLQKAILDWPPKG